MISLFYSLSEEYYRGPKTDHFDGQSFYNPWKPNPQNFLDFLKWQISTKHPAWPEHVDNVYQDIPPESVEGSDLLVTFIGHATALIQTQGLNILTDPVWALRASPFSWIGPKRVSDPGLPIDKLPKIDLILVSHNHYDHLDLDALQTLWEKDHPKILVPLGNDTIIHSYDPNIQVDALDWGKACKIKDDLLVYLEPAQHWSGRTLLDKDDALWGSFVIQTPSGNIFFAGDTGYDQKLFSGIKEKFGSFRLALLPIGTYEPRWFLSYAHMGPDDALRAFKDLGEPYSMAIHFGTFHLSDEPYEKPMNDLNQELIKEHVPQGKFRALFNGQSWLVPEN